jgi:putative ABC transport system permease protein
VRLSGLLAWLVRRLAGADAESMLADLECEAAERAARSGPGRARRWIWSELARSTPPLVARRIGQAIAGTGQGRHMAFRGLWLDGHHALRRLRRSPGFALLAIALLGSGIGATTAVFSLAYAMWLKPLPYRAPGELVSIAGQQRRTGFSSGSSGAELTDIRANLASATSVAGYHYGAILARFEGERVRLVADPVSTNLFSVLGVQPQLGRAFTTDDDGQPVLVLSDALWRGRFHGDPGVLGKAIGLNQRMTIVGVMPRGFRFPLILEADCWLPTLAPIDDRTARFTEIVARLAPGATLARANIELKALSDRLAAAYPASNADWVLTASPIEGAPSAAYRAAFTTLLAMVGLFLLIACTNLASLFATRNLARRNELKLVLAIGASPWRLARGLLIESAVVSTGGGALGLLLTSQALGAFARWLPPGSPRLGDLQVDGVALAFACSVASATAVLCALAPVAALRSLRLSDALGGARTIGASSNRRQHALVVVEVSLAAVLLIGGGAMVRSFNQLLGRDRGYVPAGVVTMTVSLGFDAARYGNAAARAAAFGELIGRVAQVPGVTVAGAATGFPGSALGILGVGPVTVTGRTDPPVVAALHNATPDYFRAMGVALLHGRFFTASDRADGPRVVVINETLERQLWPDGHSLGQHFRIPGAMGLPERSDQAEVVGVIADMHMGARRGAEIFVPFAQVPSFWADVVVRTAGEPSAMAAPVRQAIRAAVPDVLIEHVSPMQAIISDAYGLERAQSFLTALVATLGGLIALTGVYALLNQYVARRTREMGIRLVLGSSPRRLFWSVFARGLRLSLAGVAAGVGVSMAAARVLRGQVFGLEAAGPWLIVPLAIGIVAVSAVVIAISARRVVGIDPLVSIQQM